MARKALDHSDPGRGDSWKANVGRRLRLCRLAISRQRGLSEPMDQKQFAKEAGISQSHYNMAENGERRLPLNQAMKLCEAYNLSLDYLYRGDPGSSLSYDFVMLIKEIDEQAE